MRERRSRSLILIMMLGLLVLSATAITAAPTATAQSIIEYRFPCTMTAGGNWKTVRDRRGFTDQQLADEINAAGRNAHPGSSAAVDFNTNPNYVSGQAFGICDDTTLRAAREGHPESFAWEGDGGWVFRITHPDGHQTVYAHMPEKSVFTKFLNPDGSVNKNQPIAAGEAFGVMGRTGIATGIHVHFAVVGSTGRRPELPRSAWRFANPFGSGGPSVSLDYNRDGTPDLYLIDRSGAGTDSTEIHVLSGADNFQSWLLHTGTAQHQTGGSNEWVFLFGDHNRDGYPDLYLIDKEGMGTASTEIHILSGADNFQTWLLHTGTPLHRTGQSHEWVFQLGDQNRDGFLDLYAIDKEGMGSNSTEVHVLSGSDNFQTWLVHAGTAQHLLGLTNEWSLLVGDHNRDGAPDLYLIDRAGVGTNSTEVHVLSGADNFQTWLLHTSTPMPQAPDTNQWMFQLGDHNKDGHLDITMIDKAGPHATEAHVLSGHDNFQTWLLHIDTSQVPIGSDCEWVLPVGGQCLFAPPQEPDPEPQPQQFRVLLPLLRR